MPFEPDQQGGFVPDDPSAWGKVKDIAKTIFFDYTPVGKAWQALDAGNKAIERGAYKTGGVVTDLAANVTTPENAAAAGYGANVGLQAVPAILGGQFTSKVGTPIVQGGATRLMTTALKPAKDAALKGEGIRAVQTLLDEGANVTPGGLAKLDAKISGLNSQIMDEIKMSGAQVDINKAATSLEFAKRKFLNQVLWQKDTGVVEKAFSEFLNNPLFQGATNIPVQLAQKIKQGTYQMIGAKPYGELGSAEVEAAKSLARGLKDEIAKAVPGIDKLNAAESELLNAKLLTEVRVLQSANTDPGGIVWLSHHPATALAWLSMRSPFIKSMLAQVGYHGATPLTAIPGQAAGAVYAQQHLGQAE